VQQRRHLLARIVASAGALGAAAGIAKFHWYGVGLTLLLSTVVVGGSGILLFVRRLGAEIAARAIWIATALLALLDLAIGPRVEHGLSATIAACAVGALVAAGSRGMTPEDARGTVFEPRRHRGALIAVMCLALVNAVSLTFFGAFWLELGRASLLAFPLAAALGASAWGIYRMRTWGVLATGATALAMIASGADSIVPGLPIMLPFYVWSSLLQLALLSPLLVTAARSVFSAAGDARIAEAEGARRFHFAPDLDLEAEREALAEAELVESVSARSARP
jgi:hypothetical protein